MPNTLQELDMYLPENLEASRNELINKFSETDNKFKAIDKRKKVAEEANSEIKKLNIDEKILSLDAIAFIEIEIFDKEIDNSLFGEISQVIEDSINEELEEITNFDYSDKKSFIRNLTPQNMIISSNLEKNDIIQNLFLNDENTLTTLKYLEIYNELNQDVKSISERSKQKIEENLKILLFINTNIDLYRDDTINNTKQSVIYTAALTSSIQDGSNPNINTYKSKVMNNINKAINSLIDEKNIKASIKIMEANQSFLNECQNKLKEIKNDASVNAQEVLKVIKDNYKEKLPEIKQTFSNELEN